VKSGDDPVDDAPAWLAEIKQTIWLLVQLRPSYTCVYPDLCGVVPFNSLVCLGDGTPAINAPLNQNLTISMYNIVISIIVRRWSYEDNTWFEETSLPG
jgi:hypothetical protein